MWELLNIKYMVWDIVSSKREKEACIYVICEYWQENYGITTYNNVW